MIPNEVPQTLETVGTGVKVVGNFRITDATQARILVSLSDKMYTRKELAAVREYSTNAADAQIVSKRPISEIIVDMPTMENLNFRIRDFGTGLTEEQVATVYCVFGESTKRNSNEFNGLLGYGCKAGFASADSFTVTSWVNGEKSIYQCVKGDSTKLHSAVLLSRCQSDEPTGIEICIPVKQSSLWTFHQEAADFYKHWPELPTINNLASDDRERMEKFRKNPPTLKGEGWEVRPRSQGNATAVAYMGWVNYTIDWNVLAHRMSLTAQKRVLFELLQNNDVTLSFKMGEVQFVDSREQLEYTDLTLAALMTRIESIFSKIKDAIQERFDGATNMWEAKKFYNGIFGTGLIEVESGEDDVENTVEKIRILDGNLTRLEDTFRGLFTWKGLPLSDACFDYVNRFDNAYPTEIKDKHHEPIAPVMVTYRKKKKRTKVNRCTDRKNNHIIASDAVAVVVNDTGLKSGQSTIARYLIFRLNSNTRTVHILNFVDSTIKNNFYKENYFDTVPVYKVSEIMADAKAWNNANKVSRTYGGGGGGSRVMKYMDVESEEISENDVPIREMEDGGYYVQAGEGRRFSKYVVGRNGYEHIAPGEMVGNLSVLAEKAGLDLDKVFIINKQTAEAKWFKQAVESGEWKNIWTYLDEVDLDLDAVSLLDSSNYEADSLICSDSAEKLMGKITDKNSLMLKIITVASAKNYSENIELADALKELGMWERIVKDQTGTVDFSAARAQMDNQYPMLDHYENVINYAASYGSDVIFERLARYINAMDLYVDLAEAGKPEQVQTEVAA